MSQNSSYNEESRSGLSPMEISGSGEMADRIRAFDWSQTSLGPQQSWSDSLFTAVNLILCAPVPMQLLWGPDLVELYNDHMIPFMSNKHPRALGQPGHECWSEAWPIVSAQLKHVLSEGKAVSFYDVLVPIERNGKLEELYWNYSYTPIHGRGGKIEGVLDITFDVTDSYLGKQQLRASEDRAVRILQSIGDAVIVTDAHSAITQMNPVAENLTGWRQEEAKGIPLSTVFNIVNEATREPVESPSERAIRLRSVVGLANHTVLISKEGEETNIDDSGAPILHEDGRLSGSVLVFRNISERRIAERERNTLTSRLNQVLAVTTDAVVTVDRNWRMTYVNPEAEKIYLPGGPLVGEVVWERFPSAVYDGSPYVEHYYRAMNERVAGGFEAFYPAPLDIWLKIDVYPTEEGIVTFSRDITEQKRSTQVLVETEKLAAVGRLAASIAHEINNPLEAVTNLLYIARSSESIQDIQDYLKIAESELQRVSVISSQTLRFYKQSTSPRPVNVTDLAKTVLAIHQGNVARAGIALEMRDRSTQLVLCFDGEIRQVLNNIIGNAIDAMSPNGGRLILRSRDATHWPTGRKGLKVTVADTGLGIGKEARAKIFDAFFTTKGAKGNGLGLWVTKQIVANHKGDLRLRSSQTSRHGTVFTLFLPSEAAEPVQP